MISPNSSSDFIDIAASDDAFFDASGRQGERPLGTRREEELSLSVQSAQGTLPPSNSVSSVTSAFSETSSGGISFESSSDLFFEQLSELIDFNDPSLVNNTANAVAELALDRVQKRLLEKHHHEMGSSGMLARNVRLAGGACFLLAVVVAAERRHLRARTVPGIIDGDQMIGARSLALIAGSRGRGHGAVAGAA